MVERTGDDGRQIMQRGMASETMTEGRHRAGFEKFITTRPTRKFQGLVLSCKGTIVSQTTTQADCCGRRRT
ncbi:MAG: hypothetical protein IT430_14940 [Phycisphaerales bacterium]|nr:hypothetical protein [Phycisphaerales bacterium]